MSNASVLYSLECQSAGERAGFSRAMSFVRRTAGQKEFYSDGLVLTRAALSTKADVVTNAAVKVYFLNINSPSTATTTAWFAAWNTSTASVTLGTTIPDFLVKVEATKSVTVPIADGEDSFFTTAMSWATTIAKNGATVSAANEVPTVTMLYK